MTEQITDIQSDQNIITEHADKCKGSLFVNSGDKITDLYNKSTFYTLSTKDVSFIMMKCTPDRMEVNVTIKNNPNINLFAFQCLQKIQNFIRI